MSPMGDARLRLVRGWHPLHFEENRFPPTWFDKHQRPAAHAKIHAILDEFEFVEEIERRAS